MGNKEGVQIFGNGKCELIANFSAIMVSSVKGETGSVKGETKSANLAWESVSSSPIVRFFGKGSVNSSPILARQW